jgi:hypothetical protein
MVPVHGQPGRQRAVKDVTGAQGVDDLDVRHRDLGATSIREDLDRQRTA